jgi:hypothetical protein
LGEFSLGKSPHTVQADRVRQWRRADALWRWLGALFLIACALSAAPAHAQRESWTASVQFQRRSTGGITGRIDLPPNTRGTFIWNGQASALKAGQNNARR